MNKIEYDVYLDKVLGGWIGKSLGGTIGCFEGVKKPTNLTIDDILPKQVVGNDDLDVQLVWMDALLNKGIYVTSDQLMETWIDEYEAHMGEYGYSKRNYARGIRSPVSGIYGNSFYKTGMGCPIRSEIWGMICPGNANLAAEYAYRDGILDHEGESVWAEQFLAAIEAEAFFEKDLNLLISRGLRFVPENSRLYACILDSIKGYQEGLPWLNTWEILRNNHSHPDCTYAPFNLGIIVMALLYGGGNFEDTLTISVNSGWDVDCTCATCGAVLGIINGKSGFSEKWLGFVGDTVVTSAKTTHNMDSLMQLAVYTCQAGLTLSREGLNNQEITQAPELPLLPVTRYDEGIGFSVDYKGYPAIGMNESKSMALAVTNGTDKTVTGHIDFTVPEGWVITYDNSPLTLAPNTEYNIEFVIQTAAAKIIWDKNIIKVCFTDSNGQRMLFDFGLCGTPICKVVGPFFDSYMDWLNYDELPPNRHFLKSGSSSVLLANGSEEWCNHKIDIDKKYTNEDFSCRSRTKDIFADAKSVNIYDDIYTVKDAYGIQGPCCLYYYQEVHSPDERKAILYMGSTDPYKIWLNGNLIYTQRDNRFWMPLNDAVVVHLREGVNQIVIKTVRCGADNQFSLVFRKYNEGTPPEYDVTPFVTDMAYSVL